MFKLRVLTLLIVILVFSANSKSYSLVKVDITSGQFKPVPLAVADFEFDSNASENLAVGIVEVLRNDLGNCGLFELINKSEYVEQPKFNTKPNFYNWRRVGANLLVVGKVFIVNSNNVEVMFKTWDPFSGTQAEVMIYKFNRSAWRRIAHKIADTIYQRLTGDKGYFDSKIVFIAESGVQIKRIKRLAIMDQDGANIKLLTDGKDLVITPKFSPNGKHIAYLSYKMKIPQIFIIDISNGIKSLVGNFPGMSFAPCFSPDGSSMLMSIARNGSSALYEFHLKSRYLKKLTKDIGTISTSPSYSPDGQKIVFNSDRSGKRRLYVMDRDGSNVTPISKEEGVYATPAWSPRGDFIAFTKIYAGKFYIGVMRPDGSGERLLTNSWLEEGPTWSPNGRVIIFTRQSPEGRSKLYAVDITGYHERLIATPIDASDPTWSLNQ